MKRTIGVAVPQIDHNQNGFAVLAEDWVLREWEPVVGRLVKIPIARNGKEHIVVGTVLDYKVTDSVAAYLNTAQNTGVFMERGEVRGLQNLAESHLVLSCAVMSVFTHEDGRWVRSRLDVPIPSFAQCEWFTEEDLKELIGDRRFFYVGRSFGSDLLTPLHLEDFSRQNEAYNFLVAGSPGSGKSTLVKMLLAGYGRNRNMNFLILDTTGELARAFRDQDESGFPLKMATLWRYMGRSKPWVIDPATQNTGSFAKGNGPSAASVVSQMLNNPGTTVVLDLSTLDWDDPFKYVFIRDVVDTLTHTAMQTYREKDGAAFNTLVVVEEAHRLVPPKGWIESGETEREETSRTILQALKETQKAGLGWMLISTRISNLDRAVYEEARVKIIGRGLSSGEDAERIRESYGPEILAQYRTLPDPVDPLAEKRSHVFMFAGPICVLSRKTPEFIEVFTDPGEFIDANMPWRVS